MALMQFYYPAIFYIRHVEAWIHGPEPNHSTVTTTTVGDVQNTGSQYLPLLEHSALGNRESSLMMTHNQPSICRASNLAPGML